MKKILTPQSSSVSIRKIISDYFEYDTLNNISRINGKCSLFQEFLHNNGLNEISIGVDVFFQLRTDLDLH